MRMSVVIPYAKGDQLREEAFNRLMESVRVQTLLDYEVTVVEDGRGGNGHFAYKKHVNNYILLNDPQKRHYNKSWCVNAAIRQSAYDHVLVVDADSLFCKDYFQIVYDYAQDHHMFFHAYNWIALMPGRDNPVLRMSKHKNIQSTGGTWFTNKHWFFDKLGGMNENYFGYGCEDGDTWFRASYLLNHIPEVDYPLIHQYHHWHEAGGNNPLNTNRSEILNYTQKHPQEVINKLIAAQVGKSSGPTVIGI